MQGYRNRIVIGGIYSITNTVTSKKMLCMTTDMQGSKNRFEFSQNVNSCVHPRLKEDWKRYGGHSFHFDVLETLEKKEGQDDSGFIQDITALFELTAKGAAPEKYE